MPSSSVSLVLGCMILRSNALLGVGGLKLEAVLDREIAERGSVVTAW